MPIPAEQSALAAFTARLFRHLDRADQRHWGHTYLAASLQTPGKKTVRRLAETVSDAPNVARSLSQFVNDSTWDWEPVLAELTAWAAERGRPRGWAIHPVLLPKRGAASVGVHRRFDPRSGRTVSCQLGVAGFGCAGVPVPAAWRLMLPASWVDDGERRRRARIPATERHRPVWHSQLAMADRLLDSAGTVPVLIEACDEADAVQLVAELVERGHAFAVAVPPTLPVVPAGTTERRPEPVGRVLQLESELSPRAGGGSGAGNGSVPGNGGRPGGDSEPGNDSEPGSATTFLTAIAQVPGAGRDTECRLITAHRPGGGPARIWVTRSAGSEGGEATPAPYAASLARLGDQSAEAVTALRDGFGLTDFEGRSFPGWHRHMTLVSAAYAYRLTVAA